MNTHLARKLRKNLTRAEQVLWRYLRRRQFEGCKFRRQSPIGPYIVDFVCFEKKMIVEVDGGQHAIQTVEDRARSAWLNSQGFQVLRFWNNEVLQETESILEKIQKHYALPPLGPLPKGKGEG